MIILTLIGLAGVTAEAPNLISDTYPVNPYRFINSWGLDFFDYDQENEGETLKSEEDLENETMHKNADPFENEKNDMSHLVIEV